MGFWNLVEKGLDAVVDVPAKTVDAMGDAPAVVFDVADKGADTIEKCIDDMERAADKALGR